MQSARAISLNGSCEFHPASNTIQVTEGGRVTAKVSEKPVIEKEAMLMYSGMTGVLSSSLPLQEVEVTEVKPGVCGYTASLPLTGDGLTLAWTMADLKHEGELTPSLPPSLPTCLSQLT